MSDIVKPLFAVNFCQNVKTALTFIYLIPPSSKLKNSLTFLLNFIFPEQTENSLTILRPRKILGNP